VAANYLRDAGFDVVVVEAAPKLGGMTTSVRGLIPEAPRHVINPCAVDPIWWEGFPASADLGLERHGLEMIHIDPCYAYLHLEGDSFAFWRDPQRTAQEIRHFSRADGETYLEFARLASRGSRRPSSSTTTSGSSSPTSRFTPWHSAAGCSGCGPTVLIQSR
jgi:phytoene dehydrogenase-like protein